MCEKETTSGVLPTSGLTTSVRAAQSGLVMRMEARTVARLAQALGAGRSHPKGRLQKKSGVFQKNSSEMRLFSLFFLKLPQDQLDLSAGVELRVEPGDVVREGQVWAVVHHNREIPPHLLQGEH